MKLLPFITLFAVLILAACGGGSEATQVPAQTMGITSTQAPLVPSVLLNDIKTAMDALESFTLESELLLKTAKDAETNLISMHFGLHDFSTKFWRAALCRSEQLKSSS